MNKEFVPYEPSLALKELGFDEPCLAHWYNETPTNSEGQCLVYYKKPWDNQKIINGVIRDYYFAPTYSQAFRWFREKHNLMFQIFYLRNGNHAVIIHKTTPEYMDLVDQLRLSSGCVAEVPDCYSYEEAELACLIKLIEIVKNKKPDV